MDATTLYEPYATLIACGRKTVETRPRRFPEKYVGQRVAIHAGKRQPDREDLQLLEGLDPLPFGYERNRYTGKIYITWDSVLGKVVATAVFAGCGQVVKIENRAAIVRDIYLPGSGVKTRIVPIDPYGDFSVGRWLWYLSDVHKANPPFPAIGHQGFWPVDLSVQGLTHG